MKESNFKWSYTVSFDLYSVSTEKCIKLENKWPRVRNGGSDGHDCKRVAWGGSLRWCSCSLSGTWRWPQQSTPVVKWHKTLHAHCGNVRDLFWCHAMVTQDANFGRNWMKRAGDLSVLSLQLVVSFYLKNKQTNQPLCFWKDNRKIKTKVLEDTTFNTLISHKEWESRICNRLLHRLNKDKHFN